MRVFQRIQKKLNWSARRYLAMIAAILLLTYVISAIYQVYKPLPKGLDYQGKIRASHVTFLGDQSFLDAQNQQNSEQKIFKQMLEMIEQAQTTIVLDMFLFNQETGASILKHQNLSHQLTQALLSKKALTPNIQIRIIVDPINTVYGGLGSENFHMLQRAGIEVISTDLRPLRASNPIWSGLWYMCCQQLGNNPDGGWIKSPFGDEKVTLRSYLELFNFKANHRKTLVVDTPQGWKALIGSANVHDGSSQHSNVAFVVEGKIAADVLETEHTVASFSQGDVPLVVLPDTPRDNSSVNVQLLTESAIYDQVLRSITALKKGDQLDLLMFYLSERQIIDALKDAQARGVMVRVLLDPNKDAFGRIKNGIPNRQVGWELHQAGIPVRWCLTQGEQCHGKMLILNTANQRQVILGSANFTARNLKNYNLETNVSVQGRNTDPALIDAQQYFDRAWQNKDEHKISVDYAMFKDESQFKYWQYRAMEWSGISTF